MRAIHVDEPGGPERLRLGEAEDPVPGPGEVLVRVHACGVNRADLLQRAGRYPPPPGASPILGLEVAGTVVANGPGAGRHAIGSRVMGLLAGGGYAELAAVPDGQLMPVPERWGLVQAAATPEAFLTAWLSLARLSGLRRGEWLLIHAAASGVGLAAAQIARELGAGVIGTTRTESKAARLRADGVTAVVPTDGAFADDVREATGGHGADVVLDMVGGPYVRETLRCLARGGRISVIGVLGGAEAPVDLPRLMGLQARIIGSTLRSRSVEEKASLVEEFVAWGSERLEDGRLAPTVEDVLPLERAADAHRRMEANSTAGKLVLQVASDS